MTCTIIAEVGINHNGDMELAESAIRAAKAAGADVVKFQNYRTEDFISDESLTYTYLSQGRAITEPQFTMFKRYEISDSQTLHLADVCRREGILFASTSSNENGVALLKEAGAAFLKNSSDYLTNLPLIRAMARTGIPTILSTGMSSLEEIDDAVRAFRGAGGREMTLLHCTSSYPAAPEDAHLRKIPVLGEVFGCPVGFSDHTQGISAAIGSVVLGACVIEKHFTLDKNLPGPDHWFSADPDELQALVMNVRAIEKQLGTAVLGPTAEEAANRAHFMLSCVAGRDLPAGHVLTLEDIAFRKPGTGLRPKFAEWFVGRKLRQSVQNGRVLALDDVI